MRILIHDYLAYPFIVQLAGELARRGHSTTLLHGGGVRAPRGATAQPANGKTPNLRIESVALMEPLRGRAGLARLLQERRYGRALERQVVGDHPDVVLSVPSSLDGQRAALRAARRIDAGFVFWLQDVYSQAIERLLARKVSAAGRLIAAYFARLEGRLLREADAVIAISEDFAPLLAAWRVPDERVTIQPNWAPLEEVRPMAKANEWSRMNRLDGVPVLLYAGTLGRKHDPALLVNLADAMPEARVVVVSEGAGAESIRAAARSRVNLMVLPLQPIERLAEVLATADVLVALLDPAASVFSVPSKVLTYLTAARPILAAMPEVNQAAQTIKEAQAGRVVNPADRSGFVSAARDLLQHGASLGYAGRLWAESVFAIGPIADRFESVLLQVADPSHSTGHAPANSAGTQ